MVKNCFGRYGDKDFQCATFCRHYFECYKLYWDWYKLNESKPLNKNEYIKEHMKKNKMIFGEFRK